MLAHHSTFRKSSPLPRRQPGASGRDHRSVRATSWWRRLAACRIADWQSAGRGLSSCRCGFTIRDTADYLSAPRGGQQDAVEAT